ncbi:hypothetical protein [Vibrio phage VP4B]|uniref:Uncharacterized protein n=1 Tax=Vibrio phage VP4B TaxID=1262540 RepID=V9LZX4_9CAUD|nr:hypothetical protein FDJ61_gp027 [Vibrio phage VP4B]AGB07141.1 hypothetical protein [Vibrio phage VP4B]
MEQTALNFTIAMIAILSVMVIAVLVYGRRVDPNKTFNFEIKPERGMIRFIANNPVKPSLGFEAHFYPKARDQVESVILKESGVEIEEHVFREGRERPATTLPRVQQYFGKRVYTFIGTNTDTNHLNVAQLGEMFIAMELEDRLGKSDDRVEFEMGVLRDLLFGFYYEELEAASTIYSPAMYNSIVEATREFAKLNSRSFNIVGEKPAKPVNFKWVKAAA